MFYWLSKLQAVLLCSFSLTKVICEVFIRLCQDVLDARPLVCILEAKSITFGFGKIADRKPKQDEGCKQRGILRKMSWTGPAGAGAEIVMAEELQEQTRGLTEKVDSGAPTTAS